MAVIYVSIKMIYNKFVDIPGKQGTLKWSGVFRERSSQRTSLSESFALRNRVSYPKFSMVKERKK
jgi:hypothetical protein